jgi:hypothetical protein
MSGKRLPAASHLTGRGGVRQVVVHGAGYVRKAGDRGVLARRRDGLHGRGLVAETWRPLVCRGAGRTDCRAIAAGSDRRYFSSWPHDLLLLRLIVAADGGRSHPADPAQCVNSIYHRGLMVGERPISTILDGPERFDRLIEPFLPWRIEVGVKLAAVVLTIGVVLLLVASTGSAEEQK